MSYFHDKFKSRAKKHVSKVKSHISKDSCIKQMSFLETGSNSSRNANANKETKDSKPIPSEKDAPNLVTSSNKWNVDLRKKGADKVKSNYSSKNNNRSSCSYSSEAFYSGKDELGSIDDNDHAKPILKLWASKSKQNANNNRTSATYRSTENLSLTNGNKSEQHSVSSGKYINAKSKRSTNEEINEKKSGKEKEETRVNNYSSKYLNKTGNPGRSNLSSQKTDTPPVKKVTTKSKLIANFGSSKIKDTEKNTSTDSSKSTRKTSPTEYIRNINAKTSEVVIINDESEEIHDNETSKNTTGKGINKRKKKSKTLFEYTHLNFLNKSNKSENKKNTENVRSVTVAERFIDDKNSVINPTNQKTRTANNKENFERPYSNFIIKTCDINLEDSDTHEEQPENKLHTATQSLLDNLNWNPGDLTNKQQQSKNQNIVKLQNKSEITEKNTNDNYNNKHTNSSNNETENKLNGEIIDNYITEMGSHYISPSARAYTSTNNSQCDDKNDTHNKRLIRTQITQIEKPTLHSRRYSAIEGSNSKDNYVSRKTLAQTELERLKRNSSYTNGVVNRKRYSFERGSSNDSEDTDKFQPKSTFLKQRLSNNNNNNNNNNNGFRKFSLDQNLLTNGNEAEFNIKSNRRKSSTTPLESQSDNSNNSRPTSRNNNSSNINKYNINRNSSSSSSISSTRSARSSSIAGLSSRFENPVNANEELDMNLGEFRRNFSMPREKKSQNPKSSKDPDTTMTNNHDTAGDTAGLSKFPFSSQTSSNRSSGISNKSISPLSSTHSLETFGSVTKVTKASKLSGATELQSSFSSKRREKLRHTKSDSTSEHSLHEDSQTSEHTTTNHHDENNIVTEEVTKMDRKHSEPRSPTEKHGPFSLFSLGKKTSRTEEPNQQKKSVDHKKPPLEKKNSITSYFGFKKTPSIDLGKENNDIINGEMTTPPISPGTVEGTKERKSSGLKRIFHKKSVDIPIDKQSNTDLEKRARKVSEKENERLKNAESAKEPTKIKTRMKYIDTDVTNNNLTAQAEKQIENNVNSIKKTNLRTKKHSLQENAKKEDEAETADKMSIVDNNSTTKQLDIEQTTSKQEKRNRRRDRRNQGLTTNDVDSALEMNKSTSPEAMEVETDTLFFPSTTTPADTPKTPTDNIAQIKNEYDASTPENDTFHLSPFANNADLTSEEYGSDCSTKGYSSNKERIKNRKAARKEAEERRRGLDQSIDEPQELTINVPVTSEDTSPNAVVNGDSLSVLKENRSPPEVMPKKRKKYKAKRSNTDFISMPKPEEVKENVPLSQDDGIVMRRNNKRGNARKDRPRTLTSGIDADMISSARKLANTSTDDQAAGGVVNENLSFAEIKKKLLEGVKTEEEKKEPEKMTTRQKIKRTKSAKRYKTITEGIAPRDLALAAQQAKEAGEQANKANNRKSIDKATLEEITASLSLANNKRKSFIVGSMSDLSNIGNIPESEINAADGDVEMKDESSSATPPPARPPPTAAPSLAATRPGLRHAKSMTTLSLSMDVDKDEDEEAEVQIKPLSELKKRFLQAMEESKTKHLQNKAPIELVPKEKQEDTNINMRPPKADRSERPRTICGVNDMEMDRIIGEVGETPDDNIKKQIGKEPLAKKNSDPVKVNGNSGEKKLAVFDDIENILGDIEGDDGISESDIVAELGLNPSLGKKETVDKAPEIKINDSSAEALSDLDFIASQTSQLSTSIATDKRRLRPQNRQRTGANPIKALQKRDDLVDESNILASTDKNQKSTHPVVDAYRGLSKTDSTMNPAKRMLRTDLADEAVSALRATVDFSKTKLKKVIVAPSSVGVLEESFKPTEFKNILIQIKGRKKVQTTIVRYSMESLNSNDCYIVVTPKDLLCWYGAQANVIERSKATEITSRLIQKKEMNCKALDAVYIEQSSEGERKVIRTLGGDTTTSVNKRAMTVNDEDFEKTLISAYMTYIVCERSDPPELIPLDSQCHRMPSKEIMQTDSVFVFDFLHEVYVWLGRKTNSAQRTLVQKLAAQKFDEGYYKLNMAHHESHSTQSRTINLTVDAAGPNMGRRGSHGRRGSLKVTKKKEQGRHQMGEKVPRPDHSVLCQLFEGSEFIVFKEKFCDWPDEARIIRMKGGPESCGEITKEVSTEIVINPVDAKSMVIPLKAPKFLLEQMDLGRGRGIPKGMDGYHVITFDVKTWHVSENNSILLPDSSFGQFHSGEGYVIRWQYRIVKVRALRNCPDPMKAGGMERCCYFFWLGNDCSVNEEGATAVMTIELDQEKGPQIRCVLGKEPPALLNLFDGSMIIHAGKRPAPGIRDHYTDESALRLYCVRNEEPLEVCLLQVPAFCESLRSRTSFVLLIVSRGEIILWHGCRSNEGTRTAAEHAAKQLISNHPDEAGIADKTEIGLTEFEEGEEDNFFWLILGGKEEYGSLLEDESDVSELCPRLFQLESTSGTFVALEIICPSKTDNHNCSFPVLQDDLYHVDQPAIFLLDATKYIYLWFGWWPDDVDVEESNSRRRRFNEERRKAMESAVLYATELDRPLESMYVVYAGLEPESFIELFPYWVVQEDISDLQLDEGIDEDKLYKITEELAMFSKEFYSYEELTAKIAPQGVDPTKLEKYLSPEDFQTIFGFSKESFYTLPGWQQTNWKKKLTLY